MNECVCDCVRVCVCVCVCLCFVCACARAQVHAAAYHLPAKRITSYRPVCITSHLRRDCRSHRNCYHLACTCSDCVLDQRTRLADLRHYISVDCACTGPSPVAVIWSVTLRALLSGTFLRRKDVVNQCSEFLVILCVGAKRHCRHHLFLVSFVFGVHWPSVGL